MQEEKKPFLAALSAAPATPVVPAVIVPGTPEALPATGGSYVRQADGVLKAIAATQLAEADLATVPTVASKTAKEG